MKRLILAFIALLTLTVGLPVTPVSAASPTEEAAFVSRINGLRSSIGLVPLEIDAELVAASRVWADQMASDDVLAHAPDITAGINQAMARRIKSLVARIGIKKDVCFTGGVAKNPGVVNSIEEILDVKVVKMPEDPQIIGALGAALFARERGAGITSP